MLITLLLFAQFAVTSMGDASNSAGNQYYVSTVGNDSNPGTIDRPWRTLRKAVSNMGPGDTTLVRGGVYNVFVPVGWDAGRGYDGSAAKNGTAEAPITLKAYPDERVVLTHDTYWPISSRHRHSMIDIRRRSHWVIDGFTFHHVEQPQQSLWWSYGIFVLGTAEGIVIRNNVFEGNGIVRRGGTVINLTYDVRNSTIQGNVFQNWPSQSDVMGVTLETYWRDSQEGAVPNTNTVIRGNTFDGMGGDGVQIAPWGGSHTLIESNTFRAKYDDERNGTAENAIDIKRSFFTTIRGNVMSGYRPKHSNPRGEAIIVHLMAEDVVIEGNRIFDNGCGITVAAGNPDSALPTPPWYSGTKRIQRVSILRNTIVDSNNKRSFDGTPGSGKAIEVAGAADVKLFHNVIAFAQSSGVTLEEAQRVEIRNNIFFRTPTSIVDETMPGTDLQDLTIGANLYDSEGQAIVLRGVDGRMLKQDVAGFQSATGQAAGAIVFKSAAMTSVFVNAIRDLSAADYRLKPASPAIDAGEIIVGYNEDFEGAGPDMGMAEYKETEEASEEPQPPPVEEPQQQELRRRTGRN